MTQSVPGDTGVSLLQLFCTELQDQTRILSNELVVLEQKKGLEQLEALMRAAHSIKSAARVVRLEPIVRLAHIMEEYFVAAQNNKLAIVEKDIDILLKAVDFLTHLSQIPPVSLLEHLAQENQQIEKLGQLIGTILNEGKKAAQEPSSSPEKMKVAAPTTEQQQDRMLRIDTQSLNRLMGLAGESLIESRWLYPFSESLMKQKKMLDSLIKNLESLKESLGKSLNEVENEYLTSALITSSECRQYLNNRLSELEVFINRHSRLSDKLYQEVIDSRMRPFADGVEAFPRMVRDLARQLGKKVRLDIFGKSTPVDREILEKLESPLAHLLRNAVDHGIETPEKRLAAGKPAEGSIKLEAQHRAGVLEITVTDDGRGIDSEEIKKVIIEKKWMTSEMTSRLSENELIEFLFTPGFSTRANVNEVSGRGVGLNVVQNMLREVSGNIHVFSELGKGIILKLQLPLTLSVIRALLVEIGGEPYAFPLARIDRALFVFEKEIERIENRQYFKFEGKNIGLIPAWQVLGEEPTKFALTSIPVVITSDHQNSYGIVVDRFLGEKELVVQELDPRLGKVAGINAGALMEDGSPILIVDVEEMIKSIDDSLASGCRYPNNLKSRFLGNAKAPAIEGS